MLHSVEKDTIAAIATARGQSALSIIRVSGPYAISSIDPIFKGGKLTQAKARTLHVGNIVSKGGNRLDQVVVSIFHAPASPTGEDVVEISCHGGELVPQLVLQEVLNTGVRLAVAGEFTKRAFLNGKIDLAQAESIAELIHSRSSSGHALSIAHLEGSYSRQIERISTQLLETVALVELELDFSEEDIEFADRSRLSELLNSTKLTIKELLGSYRLGAIMRGGVDVVIAGRPNAGKSTLLNALLGFDRAIVSSIPGTTRDKIEAESEIGGVLFRFHDTAGIRDTNDAIEAEGVRRSMEASEKSDILLYLFDASLGLHDDEVSFLKSWISEKSERGQLLLLANKLDLGRPDQDFHDFDELEISALKAMENSQELDMLRSRLTEMIGMSEMDMDRSKIVSNLRHRELLKNTLESVERAELGLKLGSGETLSKDIRDALYHLGAIVGETTNEDILGAIFSRFCIGK